MDKKSCFEIKGKVLCIITGASRGFGRALSFALSEILKDGSHIVIIARNEDRLQEVREKILQKNKSISVSMKCEDLSKVSNDQAVQLLRSIRKEERFDQAILVHNVGTLGDISRTVDKLNDFAAIQEYLDLNVTSVYTLTAAFLQEFHNLVVKDNGTLIVNVSSLAAIKAFPGWAQYCSAKSAREMYFQVLAEEFPSATVLSYSPGPMKTDMTTEIMQSALPSIQEWFKNAVAEDKLIACESSVKKLLHFLRATPFKSGSRVDYYDVSSDST